MTKPGLFAILVLSLSVGTVAAEPPQSVTVTVKTVEPFVYVCIPHTGPLTAIQDVVGNLFLYMQQQEISPMGEMLGVYHTDPSKGEPEKQQWEIGFPVSEHAFPLQPLQRKEWVFTEVATAIHTGTPDMTGETVAKINEWLEVNGYEVAGPVLEFYRNFDPNDPDRGQLRIEIWVACRKK
ncbi:MAG: GyrI-like domain-containing protein [Candidatus Aminicenantes bacterium]|nr:GyrI-like domain-containing protein [Candidatus Aminicenantes bacterium]